ncbi:MAG TPA: hypothetical protein PLW93_05525 [Candidatus Absconditabacterales bacterium]|nr:hypothetical protein [Candidatus Absconditabacterales bacterium]
MKDYMCIIKQRGRFSGLKFWTCVCRGTEQECNDAASSYDTDVYHVRVVPSSNFWVA